MDNNKIVYSFVYDDKTEISYEIIADIPEVKCENANINNCKNYMDCNKCLLLNKISYYIKYFGDFLSYENVTVKVISKEREYIKKVSLQDGVRSLLGLIMPFSGCPFLANLIPMARFHLPFSSIEETQFRVIGMYLFAQYLRKKNGLQSDWDLKNLVDIYSNIREVNKKLCDKIREMSLKDASINAIIILDVLADQVLFSVDEKELEYFEKLFVSYLND
ncbi:MAG TPA: hypothetical protein PK591_03060 [Ignavibacteriales bacterium]|nr:hypothetical protein [Ignavibacteriales bacterium]